MSVRVGRRSCASPNGLKSVEGLQSFYKEGVKEVEDEELRKGAKEIPDYQQRSQTAMNEGKVRILCGEYESWLRGDKMPDDIP